MKIPKTIGLVVLGLAILTAGPSYGQKRRKKQEKADAEVITEQVKKQEAKEGEASESFFIEGLKFYMLEDFARALERFQKAYAISANNPALNYQIAKTILM